MATESVKDPGLYVLPFGKYKGETLEEIWETDSEYLDWILDNFDPGPVRTAVKKFMESL